MNLYTLNNLDEWVDTINILLKAIIKPSDRLFVPAGETPIPLYKDWEANTPSFLSDITLVQIDEVLEQTPRFQSFFKDNLHSYQKQIEWIDDGAIGANIALLGLGLNGHVGFHEPELNDDFFSGRVMLSSETCKHLNLEIPAYGLTYGLAAFMACDRVILILRGSTKRDILKRVLSKENKIPATVLLDHKDLHIVDLP